MLGALDSAHEREHGDVVAPVAFAVTNLPGDLPAHPGFAQSPYAKALDWFTSKRVVDRATFDELKAAAKRRAFTVAGMASQQMLETARDEIAKQIEKGASLRDFRKAVADRLESAGWTPANSSHVENIFRTNVMNAYNSGRHAEMTQPDVIAIWRYWQVLGVGDARTRPSHKRVHGWVFRADDPGWHKCSCPFGFMCRCRVRAMTQKQIDKLGLQVHSWSEVTDLPDPGFVSGTDAYIAPTAGVKRKPTEIKAIPKGPPTHPTAHPKAPPPAPIPIQRAPHVPPPVPERTPVPPHVGPPAPVVHTKIVEGVHIERLEGGFVTPEERERLLRDIDDPRVLRALERNPLKAMEFRDGPVGSSGNASGSYYGTSQRIEVNAARRPSTFGDAPRYGKKYGLPSHHSVSSCAKTAEEAARRTACHELGHHIHRSGGLKVEEIVHNAAVGTQRRFSKYAEKSHGEYFAESFAAYRYYPETLLERDPRGYRMVEEVLNLLGKP